jgi:hypothetical protein
MSLGGGASSTLDNAVNSANSDGLLVVVAAGNSNTDACTASPARASGAYTVASSTQTDGRSSFSNYGSCVNVFAPGSSIYSAWYTSNSAYNTISGTSMASPHVAGTPSFCRLFKIFLSLFFWTYQDIDSTFFRRRFSLHGRWNLHFHQCCQDRHQQHWKLWLHQQPKQQPKRPRFLLRLNVLIKLLFTRTLLCSVSPWNFNITSSILFPASVALNQEVSPRDWVLEIKKKLGRFVVVLGLEMKWTEFAHKPPKVVTQFWYFSRHVRNTSVESNTGNTGKHGTSTRLGTSRYVFARHGKN